MTAVGIVHLEPGRVDLKAIAVGAPDSGELKVRALCSAISAGTESSLGGGCRSPRSTMCVWTPFLRLKATRWPRVMPW